jgi:hypothetical protein
MRCVINDLDRYKTVNERPGRFLGQKQLKRPQSALLGAFSLSFGR